MSVNFARFARDFDFLQVHQNYVSKDPFILLYTDIFDIHFTLSSCQCPMQLYILSIAGELRFLDFVQKA